MTPDERWLAAVWPFVRGSLPAAPARVAELGCGPLGGFVPMLESAGYEAAGIDPEAPRGPLYRQVGFERYDPPVRLDAFVACTSLHHVADLAAVLDLVDAVLVPGGGAVIVEWARERFDEATARWCFSRLPEPDGSPGMHTSGPGRKRRGCTPGGTSWMSLTPGSIPSLPPTGPTSLRTWPAPAKPMSRPRSTAD